MLSEAHSGSAESVQPLLQRHGDVDETPVTGVFKKYRLSPRASVVGIIGLLCIFSFVILTALFGILYYKLIREDPNKLPEWPRPSNSLLGEYSTAAVAADNEICSDIGRDMLLQGGNAVDSAIATLFCIGVMDTQSAGLGGGHFMTIYNATTKRCSVVDAREMAPAAATENMYKDRWDQSRYGWKAIAVPGELHGLWTSYTNFGSHRIPWRSLVQPTIQLMEEGYPTSHALANSLRQNENRVLSEKTMRSHFINPRTGKIYNVGEQIRTRKNFVNTLKIIANSNNPVREFYNGNLTIQMVSEFRQYGGLLTMADFANYRSKIRNGDDIIYTELGDRQICGPPPPSGSAVAQGIFNILDGLSFNLSTFDGNLNLYHSFLEASKFSYAVRSKLGDMDFVGNASKIAKQITSPEWAKYIRSRLTPQTHPDAYYGGDFNGAVDDHGTTHISVVDKHGNAVAVTSTINLILGALVMSESTGVLWNDEMDDFSSPGHPNYFGFPPSPANYIRPGKRPMSSMSPLVAFNTKTKEVLAIGGAGGSTIISGVAGAALHVLNLKYNVKQAIDFPRLHNQLKPNITYMETNWPRKYIDALRQRGHSFFPSRPITVITAVHRTVKGTVFANSDYRKGAESEPAGY